MEDNDGDGYMPQPPTQFQDNDAKILLSAEAKYALLNVYLLVALANCLATTLPITVAIYLGKPYSSGVNCLPDGSVEGTTENPSSIEWSRHSFFTLSIAFGDFSFPVAKLIDLSWDVLVGRGGQFILAVISFHVFKKSLLYLMERSRTSYQTFAALSLQGPSLECATVLAKDLRFHKGVHAKLHIAGMIFAMLYVLAFPTLLSAATSYTTLFAPYVSTPDGQLLPYDALEMGLVTTITDGHRIGLSHNYTTWGGINDIWCLSNYNENYGPYGFEPNIKYVISFWNSTDDPSPTFPEPTFLASTTLPTQNPPTQTTPVQPKFTGTDIKHLGVDRNLTSPTLNVTEKEMFTYSDVLYSPTYVSLNTLCIPGETYQWGFSFQLLFLTSILLWLWSLALCTMWIDVHRHSRFDQVGEHGKLGLLKAAMILSQAIRREFGEEAEKLTDKALETKASGSKEGLLLSVCGLPPSRSEERRGREHRAEAMRKTKEAQWRERDVRLRVFQEELHERTASSRQLLISFARNADAVDLDIS